ncbi:MAG: DNA/RNA nuclease SfsA, partial [Acidobacteriota bacterium]|nr:DNA/RNA nuclease SfsA [Acidobacteriota bacterium]
PGSRIWVSETLDPKRKLRFTLEIVDAGPSLVGVHTGRTNELVAEALEDGIIHELRGFEETKREVPFDESRIDFLLEGGGPRPSCFVEVKSVTHVENRVALFPDAITLRGQKHLDTLTRVVASGHRAVMLFVVQRTDGEVFRPAHRIDPEYGRMLRKSNAKGVDILVYRADVTPQKIKITEPLSWEL